MPGLPQVARGHQILISSLSVFRCTGKAGLVRQSQLSWFDVRQRLPEDLIVEYWGDLDFLADLEYVGRQILCGEISVLDILARDSVTDGFVVIELKRDQGHGVTFGQLGHDMEWIADNKDQPEGAAVRGIIIAAQITPKLEAAAKTNPNARLMEYAVWIELLPRDTIIWRLTCPSR